MPPRATPPRIARSEDPEPLPGWRSGATAPVAGVSSAIVSAATRRVARRWREQTAAQGGNPTADGEIVAGLLAALALAVDHGRPGYVTSLLPRPNSSLGLRLVDMLQSELLQAWHESHTAIAPAAMLQTLRVLDEVRQAITKSSARGLEAPFAAPHGLDVLVEVLHDLRSPLTSILFLAEILQRGQSGEVNDVQRRQLGLIYSAALGLSSLVADAVELARGGDELAESHLTPFSVAELMESVHSIVRPMAEEKGLAILLVPPQADHRLGHPVALSRVLLNLTTNALKFTERGSVEIGCREQGATAVTFSVADSGPGIHPEARATLFQPFRRARGPGGYCFSSTGLGLALTRRLVEALGGTLDFETGPERGTRFFFELDLPRHGV
ncbi:MAG TPA: ATP-binding protein [Gemmatimonadales bacterium]|nr:ATP-binding protein [Gemmatimonadales bacterium]